MKYAKLSSIPMLMLSLFTFCLLGVSAAEAQDRNVRVINETSRPLVQFYASNISRPGWEEDILGWDTLAPGSSVLANIDDGTGHCHFDLKAVFSDGNAVVRSNVNVCRIDTWTIYE